MLVQLHCLNNVIHRKIRDDMSRFSVDKTILPIQIIRWRSILSQGSKGDRLAHHLTFLTLLQLAKLLHQHLELFLDLINLLQDCSLTRLSRNSQQGGIYREEHSTNLGSIGEDLD